MAKIVITLIDEENGHVRIDCKPPIPKLFEIAKSGNVTAAEAYAFAALNKVLGDSRQIERERKSERRLMLPGEERFELPN